MKFSMNAKLSVAIIGHFATRGAAQQRVKLTDDTDIRKFPLPSHRNALANIYFHPAQPMLTTLLGDSIHKPIPTNGSGFTVMNSEVCRPITTTTCEWVQITSTMTSSEVMTTPMVATSEVSTSQVHTSVVNEETSSSSVASSTIGNTSGSTSAVMTPTVSATGSVTPIPSSGADKNGAGLVAGLALLLVI